MKRNISYSYLYLGICLFCICRISPAGGEKIRTLCAGIAIPSWKTALLCKQTCSEVLDNSQPSLDPNLLAENRILQREIQALRTELEHLRTWFLQEDYVSERIVAQKNRISNFEDFVSKRKERLDTVLDLQLQALPAKVVYREPCAWSSFLRINVGEQDNLAIGKTIVAKHSPVVIGNILIGVVEEVGKFVSKVRLITDAKLTPSVRVCRGSEADRLLHDRISSLISLLRTRPDLLASDKEAHALFALLQTIAFRAGASSENIYLAKGELSGCSSPLWRSRGHRLKGTGFNYDFADTEGPARDLRTGEILSTRDKAIPLLRAGDLLVTTGFDGVFPPGLQTAVVTTIEPLREGDSFYTIEAEALLPEAEDINTVFVLPPLTGAV